MVTGNLRISELKPPTPQGVSMLIKLTTTVIKKKKVNLFAECTVFTNIENPYLYLSIPLTFFAYTTQLRQ